MANKRRLPVGYTELEFIENSGTGDNISYIDTLYTPTINTKTRVKFSPIKSNGIGFFGSRLDDKSARFCCTTFTSGAQFAFAMTNKTWSNNKTNVTLGNIYDVTAYNGKQIVNGTEKTESTISSFSTTCTFKLAPVDSTGTPTGGGGGSSMSDVDTKFYLCQIWENDVLVMDLVPAKNSSNVIGMYDLVTGQFFTNAGTNSLIAGPKVDTYDLTPVNKMNVLIVNGTQHTVPAEYTELEYVEATKIASKTFNGTESFIRAGILDDCWAYTTRVDSDTSFTDRTALCTHYNSSSTLPSKEYREGYCLCGKVSETSQTRTKGKYIGFGAVDDYSTESAFKAELASQYAAGHPVIVIYAISSAVSTPNKFYYMTGGTPYSHTYIPVKNSSNVAGLYCVETSAFISTISGESFTAGPEIKHIHPITKMNILSKQLPVGYTKIEYIQGDGRSYIDTGLIPVRGDSFKFNVSCSVSPDMSNRYAIFDSGTSGSAYKTCILMGTASETSGGSAAYYKYFATGGAPSISQPLNTTTNVEITSTGIIKYNGVQVAVSAPTGDVTTNVYLWKHITSGTCSTAKFTGNFEWKDSNGTLRMNLVPAKNSSNVVGMYDLVSGQFFTNAGTGTFIAGPEVHSIHPTTKQLIYHSY